MLIFVVMSEADAHKQRTLYVAGGGWGHGVGLSQYGALGRAEAGFLYKEILEFYYHNTDVIAAPEMVPDTVDVRIDVHTSTVFTPTGELSVYMDGTLLDTTSNKLTIKRDNSGWRINSSNTDWCGGLCPGTSLTVSFLDGEPVRVSRTDNGTRSYAHGQFQLTPASAATKNCGSSRANQYCLVIADLSIEQYLYGIGEVSRGWHPEALKAQVVASRSYAVAKIHTREGWGEPFDLYTSGHDQDYRAWDRENRHESERVWVDMVDSTKDVVVLYEGQVATTFYSASNGGHTLSSKARWGSSNPYLISKPDPYDAAPDAAGHPQNPNHAWYREYSYADLSRWFANYTKADLDVGVLQDVQIDTDQPLGHIHEALVTLIGSKRTLEVRDAEGNSYGYRFYYAIQQGCRKTSECKPMRSTRFTVSNTPPDTSPKTVTVPARSDVSVDVTVPSTVPTDATAPSQSTASHLCVTVVNNKVGDDVDSGGVDSDDGVGDVADNDDEPRQVVSDNFPFSDVPSDAPYADAVVWLAEQGITKGVNTVSSNTKDVDMVDMDTGSGSKLFAPDRHVTRVQFALFLWRFSQCHMRDAGDGDAVDMENAGDGDAVGDVGTQDTGVALFRDVSSEAVQAVSWMQRRGITQGCSVDMFCSHQKLTNAQIMTMLWRFSGSPASSHPIPFKDVPRGSYYHVAVNWAVEKNIWVDENYEIHPIIDELINLNPHRPVTRARMAMYLRGLSCSAPTIPTTTPTTTTTTLTTPTIPTTSTRSVCDL